MRQPETNNTSDACMFPDRFTLTKSFLFECCSVWEISPCPMCLYVRRECNRQKKIDICSQFPDLILFFAKLQSFSEANLWKHIFCSHYRSSFISKLLMLFLLLCPSADICTRVQETRPLGTGALLQIHVTAKQKAAKLNKLLQIADGYSLHLRQKCVCVSFQSLRSFSMNFPLVSLWWILSCKSLSFLKEMWNKQNKYNCWNNK